MVRLMSDLLFDSFYCFAQPLTQKNVYLILNFKKLKKAYSLSSEDWMSYYL